MTPDPNQNDTQTTLPPMMDVFSPPSDSSPFGTKGKIPSAQWGDYQKQGFKPAVSVTSPEGTGGWLPNDKVGGYIKNHGFKLGPPEQQKLDPSVTQGTSYEGYARLGEGVKDAVSGMVHMPGAIYHAVADAPKNQSEQDMQTLGGPGALAVKRIVTDPMANNFQKGQQDLAQKHYSEAAGHFGASTLPLVGDFAAHSGEAIGQDPLRGGAELLTNLAAPKVLGEGLKIARPLADAAVPALKAAQSTVAEKVVAPIVRKPLGATLEDTRFGRNPAKAISDEGLVGTQSQLLDKSQARVGEISDAVDQTLQNHANSSVQIDASPIIDSAIDNAASAAKKTGNQAAVTRLENLRTALKTEYGPTQGTPFEMNNLKREIGQVGSDLGAFKSTDPVEASAASAMQDVYTGIKNAVNQQVPEIAPLNERISNLMSAQTALKRNLALDANKSVLSGMSMTNAPFKIAEKTISSAPVRTAAARVINAGNTLDVPPVNPIAQTVAPVGRQLGQGAIITPPPANPSGSVPFNAPPIAATSRAQRLGLILPENATPEPIRLGSGADTSGSIPNAPVPPIAATSRAQRLGLVLPERTAIEAPSVPPQGREGLLPAASRIDPTTGRVQYLTSPAEPSPIARPEGIADRRLNIGLRSSIDAMNPEDQVKAVYQDKNSGLPNGRAFEWAQNNISDTHPNVGFADIDDFKNFNTKLGEPTVDGKVFPAIGDAFKAAVAKENGGVHAFHVHGDEFHFLASDPDAIGRVVDNVNQQLKNATFTVKNADGSISEVKGVGFSHGTGKTLESANAAEKLDKQARKDAGVRGGTRE